MRGMHQPDIGMHRGGHRLAGHLGIAMCDRHRMFLVQAQQHLRRAVAEVVHQAVVQAAIAGAGIQRDVRNLQRAQRLRHHVAAEQRIAGGEGDRLFDRRTRPVGGCARLRRHAGSLVTLARNRRKTPPPLVGGGWGEGSMRHGTPPPTPLPQGEGEYRAHGAQPQFHPGRVGPPPGGQPAITPECAPAST